MLISHAIGDYGRWQLMLTFLLSLCNIPSTFYIFVPTFHARELVIWCARPADFAWVDALQWRQKTQPDGDFCKIITPTSLRLIEGELRVNEDFNTTECTEWEFDAKGSSLITEYGLLCSKHYMLLVAEMSFLCGVAIGGVISGVLSDRYGRKKTFIGSILCQTILGISVAFNPWFEIYLVLQGFLGFVCVSVVFSGFVLSIELVGGNWRTVAGISYLLPASCAFGILSAIAYFIRDWRILQLVISFPGSLILSYCWIVPESPRWLLAMGKTEQVLEILKKGAKFNNRELPINFATQLSSTSTSDKKDIVGVLHLFRTRRLQKITLCNFVIWFAVYFIYYGITLNLNHIGGDIYLNSALNGLVEIPALLVSIIVLLKMGRRWPLASTMFFSGCSCLAIIPVQMVTGKAQWLVTTFAMCCKFLIASSFAIMPIFTAELYPTKIRNIGVGTSNVPAGVALLLVPYLWNLVVIHASVPLTILGVSGLVGSATVLILPETGHTQLQEDEYNTKRQLFKRKVTPLKNESTTTLVSVSDLINAP